MPRNIELKARCPDPSRALAAALSAGAVDRGVLRQHDTFYASGLARLKLRRLGDGSAELIAYVRPDVPGDKASDYVIAPVTDPEAMHHVLSMAVGAVVDLKKSRRLLLWRNVRIHLDDVEGLGWFVEFEAVIGPDAGEAESIENLREIRRILHVADADLIRVAYADLLRSTRGDAGRRE